MQALTEKMVFGIFVRTLCSERLTSRRDIKGLLMDEDYMGEIMVAPLEVGVKANYLTSGVLKLTVLCNSSEWAWVCIAKEAVVKAGMLLVRPDILRFPAPTPLHYPLSPIC